VGSLATQEGAIHLADSSVSPARPQPSSSRLPHPKLAQSAQSDLGGHSNKSDNNNHDDNKSSARQAQESRRRLELLDCMT